MIFSLGKWRGEPTMDKILTIFTKKMAKFGKNKNFGKDKNLSSLK